MSPKRRARLTKLASLTQGAALLGTLGGGALGIGVGCDKSAPNEPPVPPTMNATASPTPIPSAPPPTTDDDAGAKRKFPILNAPPGRILPPPDQGKE